MEIKLTEKSKGILENWHAGSGRMFLSDGTGNGYVTCDLFFRHKENRCFLAMGNSKSIELTPDQIKVLGPFAQQETDND